MYTIFFNALKLKEKLHILKHFVESYYVNNINIHTFNYILSFCLLIRCNNLPNRFLFELFIHFKIFCLNIINCLVANLFQFLYYKIVNITKINENTNMSHCSFFIMLLYWKLKRKIIIPL